ncbi:hypothetical protein CEXT_192971 [Caerostris extrusa]|uniref:Glutaredoxin n=1 Tax=Caerostris extrusa TaxID=172846 RepID=A0AAV4VKR1_CAEEX|nr:hypothetical protein CEXT_192971 [Caerostris extrusa]
MSIITHRVTQFQSQECMFCKAVDPGHQRERDDTTQNRLQFIIRALTVPLTANGNKKETFQDQLGGIYHSESAVKFV